ncbi:MAG: precorrin-4 C(11)-methyltransferase [Pseudomonadota bacterium]
MKVYFVGAGPGDPELLTVKAEKLLKDCRFCIYAGSLVSPEVLGLLSEKAQKYDSARLSLKEIIALCLEAKGQGLDVIRLHSGDPSIYGAVREQMNELDQLEIDYEVVPGVSSFQAAAGALKTELTAPEVSQTIILTRTAGRTPMPKEQELDSLARIKATMCIFLSIDRLDSIVQTLVPYYGPDCPAAVVYRSSWPDQQIIRGTLLNLPERVRSSGIRKTALILVGQALARDIPASKLYDRGFSHGFRQGDQG